MLHKKIDYKFQLIMKNIDEKYKSEVQKIFDEYNMIYSSIIINKEDDIELLIEQIVSENILDRLDCYCVHISDAGVVKDYNKSIINLNPGSISTKFCTLCNSEMMITYDGKSYECLECNIYETVDTIKGKNYVFPRSKIGNFNPERHFKTWVDRILAREPEEEIRTSNDPTGEKLIEEIRGHLISKRKSIEHLTIDDIRYVLKETNKTYLNRNTSLIAKKLTGRSPPRLDDVKYIQIYSLFLKVMETRDQISSSTRCNRIYYPFYLFKLLSLLLKTPEERRILNYIHLHKESTLSSNDQEWMEICKILPELQDAYEPTISTNNRYV